MHESFHATTPVRLSFAPKLREEERHQDKGRTDRILSLLLRQLCERMKEEVHSLEWSSSTVPQSKKGTDQALMC